MRTERQQRAWDEVTRAYKALKDAKYRLVMMPNGERMYDLEAGVACAIETLLRSAATQKDKQAEASAKANKQ